MRAVKMKKLFLPGIAALFQATGQRTPLSQKLMPNAPKA
jgi:hypothetical protein